METKRIFKCLAAAALLFAVAAAPSASLAGSAEVEINFAHIYAPDHPFHKGMEKVVKLLDEKSGGSIKMYLFPSAQLGDEPDLANNLNFGTVGMGILGPGELCKRVKDYAVFEAPYAFEDYSHGVKVTKSDIVKPMMAELEAKFGMKVVTHFYHGIRQTTTTNIPIEGPWSLKGQKIAVPNQPIPADVAQYVLGGIPTPMNMSEQYLALQNGTVVAKESTIPTLYSIKMQEVQKYLNFTNHQMNMLPVIVSINCWSKLDDAQKKVLVDVFVEQTPVIDQLVMASETSNMEDMKKAGMEIVHPTEKGMEAFKENAAALNARYEREGLWTSGLYEKILNVK